MFSLARTPLAPISSKKASLEGEDRNIQTMLFSPDAEYEKDHQKWNVACGKEATLDVEQQHLVEEEENSEEDDDDFEKEQGSVKRSRPSTKKREMETTRETRKR